MKRVVAITLFGILALFGCGNKKQEAAEGLRLAASQGDLQKVKLLLDKGADVNARTRHGETALTEAAREGYSGTMKLLLEKGADVEATTVKGRTAEAAAP